MWTKLNEIMLKHRFPKPNFKGLMVDSAQANWNMLGWLIRSAPIYSIGFSHLISTPNN